MADLIDIRSSDDPRDAIHLVVERLAAGELVGLPTGNSYVLAAQASQPAAVSKLRGIAKRSLDIAVKSPDEAFDFAPSIDSAGERLCRRLWPGPVAFEAVVEPTEGLLAALPAAVREAVVSDGYVRLRMPNHGVIAAIQRLTASPLILADEPRGRTMTSPAALLESLGPVAQVLVDDGPPFQPGRCTVIRLDQGSWSIADAGLLDESAIRERTTLGIVFVCTGNTCRSPLAEAMFRKLLSERLHCSEDELPHRGISVVSAGISAGYDMPAASDSLALAEEFGLSLSRHRSRPLTDELLDRADYVFAMTAGHREAILSVRPDLAGRVHLLSREGLDIADPIGGGPAEYERCRAEIERELLVLLEHLPIDPNGIRG